MDFKGRGNDFRPRPRGPNDGKFHGNEGLRITVPNSDPRLGPTNFELGRSTDRPYFEGSDSGRRGESIRSDGSQVNSRAESIRITVGNEKFMLDQQRDPASRRLGPPVADKDPWGLKDLSAEEKLRQTGPSRSAALSSAIDALLGKASLLNSLANPTQSTKPEIGQMSNHTFPILESNQRGNYEPRLDAKPLKPALKSCLKKPSEKNIASSGSIQSEFVKSQDPFSSFGFVQSERKDPIQASVRDLAITQQRFGGDVSIAGLGFGRDLGVGQLQQSKSVEDEDLFLYGENNDSRSARFQDTTQPIHPVSKTQPQLFPIALSQGSATSDNFSSKSFTYEPAPEEMPAHQVPAEPKKEEEAGLPNDPTIANILKSIGFDFEMSRKMQERAKQEQDEQERFRNAKKKKPRPPSPTDLGNFGINMNASFLGGGLANVDIQSALREERNSGFRDDRYEARHSDSSQDFAAFSDERSRIGVAQFDQRRSGFEPDSLQRSGSLSRYDIQSDRRSNYDEDIGRSSENRYRSLSPASRYRQQQERHHDEVSSRLDRESPRSYRERSSSRDYRKRSRSRSPGVRRQPDGQSDVWKRLGLTQDWHESEQPSLQPRSRDVEEPKTNRTVIAPKTEGEPETRRVIRAEQPPPVLSLEERNRFQKEMVERKKRLQVLESEMERLRKQQNELMRKKQREKGGHKDPLLMENSKLQDVIAAQISVLRKAADDNEKMLKRSEADRSFELKEKEDLSHSRDGRLDEVHRRSRERRSPGHSHHDRRSRERGSRDKERGRDTKLGKRDGWSPRSDKRSKDGSVEKSSSDKQSKGKSGGNQLRKPGAKDESDGSEDKKPKEKAEVNKSGITIKWNIRYEYYDPGNHWCKECNMVLTNVYDVFDHLHSRQHKMNVNQYDRPWMPEELKVPEKQKKAQTAVAAIRGVEFMMGVKAFYCRLCQAFSGDPMCAEQHLKSSEHNEKYRKYLEENPFYEKRFNLDKAAGVSVVKKEEGEPDKRKADEVAKPVATAKKPRWIEASDDEEEPIKKPVPKKSTLYLPEEVQMKIKREEAATQATVIKKEEPKFGFKLGGKIATPNWVTMQNSKGQGSSKVQASTSSASTAKPVVGPALRKTKANLLPAKIESDETRQGSDGRKDPDSLDMFLTIGSASTTSTTKALPVFKENNIPKNAIAAAFGESMACPSTVSVPKPASSSAAEIPLPTQTAQKRLGHIDDTDEDMKLLGIDPSYLQPSHTPVPPPQLPVRTSANDAKQSTKSNASGLDDVDDGASSASGISMEMGSDFEVLDECEED